MRSKVFICAGMPRSGSTWLYNAVRCLALRAGADVYGAWIQQYDPGNPASIHVLKIHQFDDRVARYGSRVFTSRRDLRDVAASLIRRKWNTPENVLDSLDFCVTAHRLWRRFTRHELVYEILHRFQLEEMAHLADLMGLDLAMDQVQETKREVAGLAPEPGAPDGSPPTLLHRQHVLDGRSGYYGAVLSPELIETINTRYEDWLREFGYCACAKSPD